MSIRPAHCYRSPKKLNRITKGCSGHARKLRQQRAYSRIAIKVPDRNYIGAAPQIKVRQFNMGNPTLKYDTVADLIVEEALDIRDNAIESVRATVNRKLVKDLGKDGYFMKVRVFPSNIMRENKQAQGAGADRVSQGMSLAFGIPIGRAARVRKGQVVFSILCMKEQMDIVKKALHRAKAKFPCKVHSKFHNDIKSLGTLPTKAIEELIIEVKKTEAAPGTEGTTPTAEGTAGAKTGAPAATDTKGTAAGAKTPAAAPAGKTDAKAPAKNPGKKGN
ncbi:MAG: 50S ribosomal protein L16 [Candidatus Diapherotrites archaeon]|nr:50S ribosomal protein L16 [Candidatus Diapherotrites archaeon]